MSDKKKKKRPPRRQPAQLARDRREVAALYRRGLHQAEIAAQLDVSQATISRDLKVIQAHWVKSTLVDFDAARGRELANIDYLERQYWMVWDRSLEDIERSVVRYKASDGKPVVDGETIRTDPGLGDLQALAGVQWCIDRRCRLLGLDAPTKLKLTSSDLDAEIENELARLAGLGEGEVPDDSPNPTDPSAA